MRVIATIVSMLVFIAMAVPAAAQESPAPDINGNTPINEIRSWVTWFDAPSFGDSGCSTNDTWRGWVMGGLLQGVENTDPNFPVDSLVNIGGICYNQSTRELRMWSKTSSRRAIRLYKLPSAYVTKAEQLIACNDSVNSVSIVRTGDAFSVEDEYTLYSGISPEQDFITGAPFIMGIANNGCTVSRDTRFRPTDAFSPEGNDFSSPLSPFVQVLYDDDLSDDGGFPRGFFGYVIWTISALATLIVVFGFTKSTQYALIAASGVSILAIWGTDVPDFAIVFPAFWIILVIAIPFIKR